MFSKSEYIKSSAYIKNERTIKINPVTTMWLILMFSVVLTIGTKASYLTVLIISLICLTSVSLKKAIQSFISVCILLSILYIIRPLTGHLFWGSIYIMILIMLKYIPIIFLGKVMSSYSSSYLMAGLRKIRIKGYVNIGITIFFRFMPEIFIRAKETHQGLKIRGFKASITRPIKSFELYFVPILYKCIDVSDTLTCSIISKGIEYECDKTTYHSVDYSIIDKVILLVGFIIFGVSIWK